VTKLLHKSDVPIEDLVSAQVTKYGHGSVKRPLPWGCIAS